MKALHYLVFFSMVITMASCKKDATEDAPDSFSFKYNGQTYNGLNYGGIEGNGSYGPIQYIFIHMPDNLNSTIYFNAFPAGCAFMIPNNDNHYSIISNYDSCNLYHSPGPIDSSQVYFYRSGHISYTMTDCVHKKPALAGPGQMEYDECTLTGNFIVILGNNNNQTISITEGKFIFHKVRK